MVFTDIGGAIARDRHLRGRPRAACPAITFKIFERKNFRNAGDSIEPRDMAIGDVDGDGRSDIVLIIHDRVVVLRQDPGNRPQNRTSQSMRPRKQTEGRRERASHSPLVNPSTVELAVNHWCGKALCSPSLLWGKAHGAGGGSASDLQRAIVLAKAPLTPTLSGWWREGRTRDCITTCG